MEVGGLALLVLGVGDTTNGSVELGTAVAAADGDGMTDMCAKRFQYVLTEGAEVGTRAAGMVLSMPNRSAVVERVNSERAKWGERDIANV